MEVDFLRRAAASAEDTQVQKPEDLPRRPALASEQRLPISKGRSRQRCRSSTSEASCRLSQEHRHFADEALTWSASPEVFHVHERDPAAPRREFCTDHLIPVLHGRPVLFPSARPAHLDSPPAGVLYLDLAQYVPYLPICADFGPVNIAAVHRFCEDLAVQLLRAAGHKVVCFCAPGGAESANAVVLLGAFLVLRLHAAPATAMAPFRDIPAVLCPPFRDAAFDAPARLPLADCLAALALAAARGFYSPLTFSPQACLALPTAAPPSLPTRRAPHGSGAAHRGRTTTRSTPWTCTRSRPAHPPGPGSRGRVFRTRPNPGAGQIQP
jgi:hypothetical protein